MVWDDFFFMSLLGRKGRWYLLWVGDVGIWWVMECFLLELDNVLFCFVLLVVLVFMWCWRDVIGIFCGLVFMNWGIEIYVWEDGIVMILFCRFYNVLSLGIFFNLDFSLCFGVKEFIFLFLFTKIEMEVFNYKLI